MSFDLDLKTQIHRPDAFQFNVDRAIKGCMVGALVHTSWNVTAAARLTGMSRATFNRKIREYDIKRPG